MMTRKAFLREVTYQCIHLFESRASSQFSFLDPSCAEQSQDQDDQDALYREAMHLGIDPGSMGGNRLKETIRKRQNESVHD